MSSLKKQSKDGESLGTRSNRLFKYQQSHKAELPAPPTPMQRRQKRVARTNLFRRTKVSEMHDSNRNLLELGFSNSSFSQSTNVPQSAHRESQPEFNSETDEINKEIVDNISSITESKRALSVEISNLIQIASQKDKTHDALNKMIAIIQYSNDKMLALQESTQQNLLRLLALHKDQEIANMRRDQFIAANSDRIQSIETKMACSEDLSKIWLTFTCDNELEQLKLSGNIIKETKNILKRMDIDIDKFGILPIRSVHFQHIKVANNFVPTLCVSFTNDRITFAVRRQIMLFNIKLEEENRLSDMRYNEKIFWSKNVWKILKICWELRRVKLIENANVHAEGIRVQYKIPEDTNKVKRTLITNFNDVDCLRNVVNDIFPDSPCTVIYDDDYFKLSFDERDLKRSGEISTEAFETANEEN